MPPKDPPTIDLTVHLVKRDFDRQNSIVSAGGGISEHTIAFESEDEAYLFIKKPTPNPPKWGRFFAEQIELGSFGLGAFPAAVLVVKIDNRWLAITFGPAGRSIIDPECTEERFGLLVTLNSIPETNVRSIDSTAFDARGRHSRVQTNKEAPLQEFGLDVERDLVRAVTGTPDDHTLGRRLHGMDALRATVNVVLQQLPGLLSEYMKRHRSKKYKKHFGWIDQIKEVKDSSLIRAIDDKLLDHIHKEEFERCWMAVPEIIDWGVYSRFRYGMRKRNAKHHDVHLPALIEELNEISSTGFKSTDISLQMLRSRRVMRVAEDGLVLNTWPAYKCLYAEIDYKRNTYLLSAGKWYCVSRDLVQEGKRVLQQSSSLQHRPARIRRRLRRCL